MNPLKDTEATVAVVPVEGAGMTRRSFFKRATIVRATSAAALSGLVKVASAQDEDAEAENRRSGHGRHRLAKGDRDILVAAEIAEALAVTTYTNIINTAPFFDRLPSDDQGYLVAARQEEMSHYLLEQTVTDHSTPQSHFPLSRSIRHCLLRWESSSRSKDAEGEALTPAQVP